MKTRIFLLTLTLTALVVATATAQPPMRHRHHASGLWESLAADFDHDGNGEITPAEMAGAEETFGHFDRNGDGVLTADDFEWRRHFRMRHGGMGAGILTVHADADSDGEVTSAEWQTFVSELDGDGNGTIDEAEWLAAAPPPAGHEPPPQHFAMLTRMLDRDNDGILEPADLEALFADLDADGDGVVEAGELPRHRRRGPRGG